MVHPVQNQMSGQQSKTALRRRGWRSVIPGFAFASTVVLALTGAPATWAQTVAPQVNAGPQSSEIQQQNIDTLFELLMLRDTLEVMRTEGMSYGTAIGTDLFAGTPTPDWDAKVAAIYDLDSMIATVHEDFAASLDGADLEPIIAFFGSARGQMIVGLEVSARAALLDEAVEDASVEMANAALAEDAPRMGLVQDFVEVNNLIETNVAAALNSNLAFYDGLIAGQAFGGALSQDDILADVWAQEPDIRDTTTEWIQSFLFMAYQPLEDADLEAYIAFSHTEAGAVINRAMFESFERLFNGISRALGRAAAFEMTSQEL